MTIKAALEDIRKLSAETRQAMRSGAFLGIQSEEPQCRECGKSSGNNPTMDVCRECASELYAEDRGDDGRADYERDRQRDDKLTGHA